jgi:curved DNA-binding protein CbpA
MTWNRAQLLAWLDRTEGDFERLTLFELLEIPPTASGQHVQRAFHAIAATRHPDVWRNHLDDAERERLTRVYGRIASAYAILRNDEQRARVLRDVRERRVSPEPSATAAHDRGEAAAAPPDRRAARATMASEPPPMPRTRAPSQQPFGVPASSLPAGLPERAPRRAQTATGQPEQPTLGARALAFYRRAEASLRVGDVAGALLNLRMALAAEPGSQFLKDAIAEAQARLSQKR